MFYEIRARGIMGWAKFIGRVLARRWRRDPGLREWSGRWMRLDRLESRAIHVMVDGEMRPAARFYRSSWRAARAGRMTRLAHITDLHFGAEDDAVVKALRDELNRDRPDLVAVSGDLTQGARISEFRAAKAFLDSLVSPWLAVPGNHDISPYNPLERFVDPYRRWRREISAETAPSWRNSQVAVVGLNSARRMSLHWDFSRGRVTRRRLGHLLAALDAEPAERVRVVVMHHPLLAVEGAPKLRITGGADRALKMFAAHRVTLVLAGHLHRGYLRTTETATRQPLVLQGGTATSVRLRGEPNAYNRIFFGADGAPEISTRIWDGFYWRDASLE